MMTRVIGLASVCAGLLSVASCVEMDSDESVGEQSFAVLAPVTWTNVVGATAVDNDLSKSGTVSGYNAGAVSVETLSGAGAMEFTTAEANTSKMAGLSNGDTDQDYTDIDHAISLTANGRVQIYEGGIARIALGSYQAGDVFRVEVAAGGVRYLQNGALLFTSAIAPTFPLSVDTSLKTTGATITDVTLGENDVWQNAVGVSASGNDLIKTAAVGWNAGASTIASISDEGYVEFTTAESNKGKMGGLSGGDTDQHYADIDFAIFLTGAAVVRVYENGVDRGAFGAYIAGDVFRVAVSGGVVTYLKNGTPFYVSAGIPTFPLLFDCSLNQVSSTIQDVRVVEVPFWQNEVGVAATDNDLVKTGGGGWNAGASTTDSLDGDGYAEFTTAESTKGKMAGLGNGDTDQNYTDIDFAIFLTSTGRVQVYESGVMRGAFGMYVAGDVFRVQVTGGVVTYLKNGTPFHTSVQTPVFPLLFDTSLNQTGTTINDVALTSAP